MNSDVNCTNVGSKNKNSKILVSQKEPIRRSLPSQCNPCASNTAENSELGNKISGKTDQDFSTVIKKQICRILPEKDPKIDNSKKISHLQKHRVEKIEKAEIEAVRETKEEEKLSRVSVSDKKSKNSALYIQRSTLKNRRDISNNGFDGHVHKKVNCEASREKSFPKAKETCRKSIQSMANKSIIDRETRKNTEAATIEKRRQTSCIKKYSIKTNMKDKIELDNKKIDDGIDGSKKSIQNTKVSTLRTVDGKKSMPEKTTCDYDASKKNNGAARTRIFQYKRRSLVNKNFTSFKDNECKKNTDSFKGKLDNFKTTLKKEDRKRHEIETNDSIIKKPNADPVDFSCSTQSQNIISLFQRGLSTPESSSDSNQFQKFEKNYMRSTADRVNNNSTSDAGIGTSCETALQTNIDIDLSRAKVKKKYEKELIASSINVINHDQTEITKSRTSVFQDDVIYYSNLVNYECHSDQQHSKRASGNLNEKYTADGIIKSIEADEKKNTSDNDAKYNLMKALIHPASEIHHFKGIDKNFTKLSEPRKRSESVLDCRDEGFQNYYINYLSNNGSLNDVTPSLSNNVQQLENDIKSSNSFDSLISHPSLSHFKGLWRGNISDYDDDDDDDDDDNDDDTINLKMQGCNYTKRYRHFKHEEKKMCCSMARYIEKMVSNERKHQEELEKKINQEREEVKIIIDENSPKTSKISIVNDRSSISVVCHSLGRIVSPNERKNNVTANKAESSGGESSGYKSLRNSNTKNFDISDHVEIKSMMEQASQDSDKLTSRYRYEVHFPPYDSFDSKKTLKPITCKGSNVTRLRNSLNKLREENFEIEENASNNKCEKESSTEIKFTLSDTKKYLSTFTNCMDGYLPSEITAYQLKEVRGNELLQFDDNELLEKDTNDPELRIGNYLESENSDSEDESSEEDGSSEEFGFFKGNVRIEGEVIVLKSSDNLNNKSTEMVVDQRFMNPNHESEARTNSTNISIAPAQLKIITSLEDIISIESTTESSSISPEISNFKLETNNAIKNVKPIPNLPKRNHGNGAVKPMAEVKHASFKPTDRQTCCLKKLKNEHKRLDDVNAIHELWANKKSTADSTDNESQQSVKSSSEKNDANRFKFKIFNKLSRSSNEKRIQISLHQLPKPPTSFLESSVPSQSTVLSSTADTETFESDDSLKPSNVDITSISPKNSATKVRTDNPRVHQSIKAHMNAFSNGEDDPLQFQPNDSSSVPREQIDMQPGTSITPPKNKHFFEEAQELNVAVSPPASAVPPPYPFCCPFVPYMMQHWQNSQQPPPASTVPLPEANWKSNIDMGISSPPPPGMVPFPWFSQLAQRNNNDGVNNLYTQPPPPEWLMMPRGYAPCLPCSKTHEQHLKKADSSITEEDESIFETNENKQDEKKKTVSHKLFKIFRKKTKGDLETVDEDEKKGKYLRTRSDSKPMHKVQVEQNVKQDSDERNIWESPDIAGIVTPEEIGRCFRRGFRADGLTLSGDDYLCTRAPSDTTSGQEDVFNFSEHDTPLDFLLALGFSVDEATAAIRDDEVRRRFKAALTEARIWVPHIATTQGTLLYLLAMKAKPKVMRYFLQLVESIVNKRITNAVKLDAYLKILEKVEDGYVSFVTLFGKDKGQEYEEDTVIVEKQRRRIFYTIYKYAELEAEEVSRPLTKASVDLLHSLAARYRSAIGPHLRLLACYIGEGLLTKDVQLEAALIYLSRLDSADVRLEDLEKYCGLPPSERRRQEQTTEINSSSDKV